ncbi:hypothetical protein [Dysgonomonas macrotermitis]|uniref:Lipoprotein n=1 Tax=Dysgonomonas macrotermitis TaxID=1346286 RepID=A0A1M5IT66_9BACT|nr:hypothetical protein [Dysgonomonas macrotermitis]SHG31514.1 hypothetical protein SAMN05444362_12110 [Dysgonomonas macrotermitis]
MKQLLTILFAITLFACSSDENEPIVTQDYTSFTIARETDNSITYNCVIGYQGSDGIWIRVASLGDIKGKTESKEIIVDYAKIKEVYMFQDYYENGAYKETLIAVNPFVLKENIKNTFIISNNYSIRTVNKDDPKQYPI